MWSHVTITENRVTILGAFVAYFHWIVFINKGFEFWRYEAQFWEQKTEKVAIPSNS
jgi:hypothetical protein